MTQQNKKNEIIVSNFGDDITEEDIKEKFSEYGNIKKIFFPKIHCFITYSNKSEAKKAIEKTNGTMFYGETIKVKTYKTKEKKFFPLKIDVSNISYGVTEENIKTHFSEFGKITDFYIQKRFCFITYENENEGNKAIKETNGTMFFGETIKVEIAKDIKNPPPPVIPNRIFVGNISNDVTEEDIKTHFSKFGKITEISIRKGKDGKSRFCFITYSIKGEANKAIKETNGTMFYGQTINVEIAKEKPKQHKIYVGNISDDVTEEDTKTHFSQFGKITDFYLGKGKDGKSKRFCVITYNNENEANKAIEETDGTMFYGQIIKVKIYR